MIEGILTLSMGMMMEQLQSENLNLDSPPPAEISLPYELSGESILIYERESGTMLYEQSADEPRAMASLTKMATALQALERYDPEALIPVPLSVQEVEGAKLWLLPGDTAQVSDLLSALLIRSGNDVAVTLAGGDGETSYVEEMNRLMRGMGLEATVFRNPHGLDEDGHVSTGYEMLMLGNVLLEEEILERVVERGSGTLLTGSGESYEYVTTNALWGRGLGVNGVKTGTTDEAGQCFLGRYQDGERDYLFLVMGSQDRWDDSRKILHALGKESL